MGKVYDALRRAEAQRAQRSSDAARASAAAPEAAPAPDLLHDSAPAPVPVRPAVSRWRRMFRRADPAVAVEGTGALNKRRIALLQPESFVAEQFRSLRARIDSIAATRPIRSIGVTSALPGDGKTISSISLAVVTAMQMGRRVLLVDCDLRKPHVHQALGVRMNAGLAEILTGQASVDDAIVKMEGSELQVLPVRTLPQNPSELLASEAMRELLTELGSRYDRVILDLPPTLGLPDAKEVSELCDGVVFVVRADETPGDDVASALEVLDRSRVLGLVLNGADPRGMYRYGYR